MNVRPNVQVSPNLRIDDRTAGKIVDQTLLALAHDEKRVARAMGSARTDAAAYPLGNPLSQKRTFGRIWRATGDVVLFTHLEAGKRKRFRAILDLWSPTSPEADGSGPLTWLVGTRLTTIGHGLGSQVEQLVDEIVALTRHALVRLLQRGGASTPEDLTALLKGAWPLIMLAIQISGGGAKLPSGVAAAWLLPMTRTDPTGGQLDFYLAIKRGDETGPRAMIATVLDGKMIVDAGAFTQLEAMLASGDVDPGDPAALAAFEATARAARRGRAALANQSLFKQEVTS